MTDEQRISYVISTKIARESNACLYKRELTGQFIGSKNCAHKNHCFPHMNIAA
jgi:hypothetical protein